MTAYRKGDYETALRECEEFRAGPLVMIPYHFFRGGMLLQLGKLVEAEAFFRVALNLEDSPRSKSLVYSQLGTVMLEKQEFNEAIVFFEDSIRVFSKRGGSYRAIAEVRLRQRRDLGEALMQAEKAVAMDRMESELNAEGRNTNLAEDLGVLAWAVAEVRHDQTELERILAEAFHLCGTSNVPMLAKLHYHAGESYKVLRVPEKAFEHFRKAAELDPQGIVGRIAASKTAS